MKNNSVITKWFFQGNKIFVLFSSLLLTLLIVACSGTPTVIHTTVSPPHGSTLVDARTSVINAIQAHLTAGPYLVVASITSGTTTTAMHGEVVLPEKFHLFSSISGGPEREYIIIGSTTYAKIGGNWAQLQIDLSGMLSNFIDRLDPNAISDVRLVGPEDVNGIPAIAYTYTYTNTIEGALLTSNVRIWVGVDSGLPLKQMVDGEVNGVSYQSEQTLTYNSSITIEAPTST